MLITMPPAPVAASIDWSIDVPAQVNRSEFTGDRKIALLPQKPRWRARVTLPAIVGEPNVLAWRAFVVDLDGVANKFRLIACERPQITGVTVTVKGGGQRGYSVVTKGWGAPGIKLLRGQFVTIGDQLLMLMAPVIADANGEALLKVKAYLRVSPANDAPIEVTRPYAVVSSTDQENGWGVGIGQNYAISFDCEEA